MIEVTLTLTGTVGMTVDVTMIVRADTTVGVDTKALE